MIPGIKNYCDELVNEFETIAIERKAILNKISEYIKLKAEGGKSINLIYVCTHNSRRSQLGQVWGRVAADYYKIMNVHTFSGGTEETSFNSNAIAALTRIGFIVKQITVSDNPIYEVVHSDDNTQSICFSKVYNHPANPKQNFAAIMTCGDAEQNCPFIPGVDARIATTYNDPKVYDDTAEASMHYDKCCRIIALETLYVFS